MTRTSHLIANQQPPNVVLQLNLEKAIYVCTRQHSDGGRESQLLLVSSGNLLLPPGREAPGLWPLNGSHLPPLTFGDMLPPLPISMAVPLYSHEVRGASNTFFVKYQDAFTGSSLRHVFASEHDFGKMTLLTTK